MRPKKELIHSVFEFTDTPVKAVMVPRTEIHAIEVHASLAEVAKSFVESGFSRIPVYEGELDKVIGILYNKDVFKALQEKSDFRIRDHLHPAFFVPSTLPISELLKQLQRRRLAMALVVNEFGEIEGLATLEDLVEEIVGEIRDEYDREERGPVERLPDGSMVIQGSALLKDLKTDFELPFEESPDYHTLAGFMLARLKRIPRGGEWVEENGYKLTIVDMEGRRIVKIKARANRVKKLEYWSVNGVLVKLSRRLSHHSTIPLLHHSNLPSTPGSRSRCRRDRENKPRSPGRGRPIATPVLRGCRFAFLSDNRRCRQNRRRRPPGKNDSSCRRLWRRHVEPNVPCSETSQ